jgi:cell division protein FtsA
MFMQKENIIAGIDIGSSNIRTIIAEQISGEENLRIIGVSVLPSFGVRRGVITDVNEVAKIINQAVLNVERMAGVEIKKAIINIGGSDILVQETKGVIAVGRADGEVIEDDVNRVINEAQAVPLPMNNEIVHIVPKKFRLDDKDNIKDPIGMKGVRLEVNALVIESSSSQVKNITKCAYQSNIEIDDIVLEPLAAARAVLSKKQLELGVVLINIGGGATSLAVYEEGQLLYTSIIPIGAGHITNDIAIGLRTSVEVAEKIKLEYGYAKAKDVNEKEGIDLSKIDSQEEGVVSRYHVAEIIEARMEEIFDLVLKELKAIGKSGLLPAGAVLVGGGARMPQIIELAKEKLRLPIQIGYPIGFGGLLDKIDDPSFATVSGLILWSVNNEFKQSSGGEKDMGPRGEIFKNFQQVVGKAKKWMGKFLP